MRLFLDTEYNGFGGSLISMALAAENGDEWYRVLPCAEPTDWIKRNVIPVLNKRPYRKDFALASRFMKISLARWLQRYPSVHITADYPTDFEHFSRALILGHGVRILTPPLTLELRSDLPSVSRASAIPHNALEDARALRRICLDRIG